MICIMGKRTKNSATPNKQVRAKQTYSNAGKNSKTQSVVPKQSSSKEKKVKKATPRTNHSNCPIFRKAVKTWFIPKLRKSKYKTEHARLCGVEECHIDTFLKYVKDDPTKRRILGKFSGRPSNVDEETTKALIQHSLINAEIVKKLQELIPITPSAAMNYLYRTFPKRLNAKLKSKKKEVNAKKKKKRVTKHQKPTPQHSKQQQYSLFSNFRRPVWFRKPPPTKLDDVNGYRFVQLPKGTSTRLQSLVDEHVIEEENEQYVFTFNSSTYKRLSKGLSKSQMKQFTRLKGTKDSYTDGSRRLENIHEDFNTEELVSNILSTLRTNLDVQDHNIEEPVLLTTEKRPEWEIFRQQLHRDFQNGDDSSLFVIIPLCEDQTLYYEKNEGISSIKLSKDVAFVGHSQLIHAGSEQPGKRLHFKLVEEGTVEDTKTYFVKDSSYPRIDRILKLF